MCVGGCRCVYVCGWIGSLVSVIVGICDFEHMSTCMCVHYISEFLAIERVYCR